MIYSLPHMKTQLTRCVPLFLAACAGIAADRQWLIPTWVLITVALVVLNHIIDKEINWNQS